MSARRRVWAGPAAVSVPGRCGGSSEKAVGSAGCRFWETAAARRPVIILGKTTIIKVDTGGYGEDRARWRPPAGKVITA